MYSVGEEDYSNLQRLSELDTGPGDFVAMPSSETRTFSMDESSRVSLEAFRSDFLHRSGALKIVLSTGTPLLLGLCVFRLLRPSCVELWLVREETVLWPRFLERTLPFLGLAMLTATDQEEQRQEVRYLRKEIRPESPSDLKRLGNEDQKNLILQKGCFSTKQTCE